MVDSTTRLRGSAAFSMGAHAALLAAFLLLRTTTAQNQPVLTHIEFMDLRPAPVETAAEPAQTAPRNLRDFLRLALPQFRPAPAAPQEAQPLEAPRETARALQDVRVAPSLRIDSRTLDHAPSVRLNGPKLARAAASFSDVAASAGPSRPTDIDPADVKPDIQLDAVGRRAVRGAGTPSIRIDPNARFSRTANLGEVASLPTAPAAAQGTSGGEPGIKLVDDGGPPRAGRLPPPVIGYGAGSGGGGLSLQDRPVERPRAVKIEDEPAAPKKREREPLSAARNKAFELTGPLAKRKIASMSLPAYPDWAKEKGVEAETSIRFFVSPEGRVRDRILIERTSGYDDLDRLCVEALKTWIFVPLAPGDEEGDQWGIVTFRFRLK